MTLDLLKESRICLGVITGDFIKTQTVSVLLGLIKESIIDDFIIQQGPYIHDNRERVALMAQERRYTHLFFVDWDMVFGPTVPMRLLEHDKDIVAAMYNIKVIPTRPVTIIEENGKPRQMTREEVPKKPFKCYATGAGCMLIKMSVFDKIPRPWFSHHKTSKGIEGEDVWFCNKARKAGFNIWVDPTIPTQHVGNYNF